MYKKLNSKQRDVMITILLMANHKENQWEYKGEIFTVKPGQFVTSLDGIKEECADDVSIQNIRTALLKLEKWGFLTNKSTKTGRLITVVNWGVYQSCSEDQQTEEQTSNKELTPNKNVNNSITTVITTINDQESKLDESKPSDDWLQEDVIPGLTAEQTKDVRTISNIWSQVIQREMKSDDQILIETLITKDNIPVSTIIEAIKIRVESHKKRHGDNPWQRINGFRYVLDKVYELHHARTNPPQLPEQPRNNVRQFPKQQQPKGSGLPKAVREQLEREAREAAGEVIEPQMSEEQRKKNEEKIKAKMKLMNEKLKNRGVHHGENGQSAIR